MWLLNYIQNEAITNVSASQLLLPLLAADPNLSLGKCTASGVTTASTEYERDVAQHSVRSVLGLVVGSEREVLLFSEEDCVTYVCLR